MFASELRNKSVVELQGELTKLLKQQFSLKLQAKMGQLKDVAAIKKVRRDIARVNTVLAEVLKASNKEGK